MDRVELLITELSARTSTDKLACIANVIQTMPLVLEKEKKKDLNPPQQARIDVCKKESGKKYKMLNKQAGLNKHDVKVKPRRFPHTMPFLLFPFAS